MASLTLRSVSFCVLGLQSIALKMGRVLTSTLYPPKDSPSAPQLGFSKTLFSKLTRGPSPALLCYTSSKPSQSSRDLAMEPGVPSYCWIRIPIHQAWHPVFDGDRNHRMMDSDWLISSLMAVEPSTLPLREPCLARDMQAKRDEYFYDPTLSEFIWGPV